MSSRPTFPVLGFIGTLAVLPVVFMLYSLKYIGIVLWWLVATPTKAIVGASASRRLPAVGHHLRPGVSPLHGPEPSGAWRIVALSAAVAGASIALGVFLGLLMSGAVA